MMVIPYLQLVDALYHMMCCAETRGFSRENKGVSVYLRPMFR